MSGGKALSEQEKRILEQKDPFPREDTAITQAGWGTGAGFCLGDVEWWSKFNLQNTSISYTDFLPY